VIRAAEDRRSASAMISSSIRLSLAGFDVGWMMNMSSPRTFSKTSTKISPSLKRSTRASTSDTCMPRCIDMRRAIGPQARVLFAFPEMSFGSLDDIGSCPPCHVMGSATRGSPAPRIG
jgi:hypothetical protein